MDRLFSAQTKQIALVVLAVTLVALAGCSTGDDGGTATTPTPNSTVTDTTTTTTPPTSTPSPPPESDISPDELASGHVAQVEQAASLTNQLDIDFSSTVNGSTTTGTVHQAGYYDFEDGTALRNITETGESAQSVQRVNQITYTRNNETYLRLNSTRLPETRYFYNQAPYNETGPSPINFSNAGSIPLVNSMNAAWQSQGETTVNGQTVTEYTASGTESLPNITQQLGNSFSEIDGIDARMLVTDDGLITKMHIQANGTANGGAATMDVEFTVSNINSTTVPEPTWLDQVNTTG